MGRPRPQAGERSIGLRAHHLWAPHSRRKCSRRGCASPTHLEGAGCRRPEGAADEPAVEDQPRLFPSPLRDGASRPWAGAQGGAPWPPPSGSSGAETPGSTACPAPALGDQRGSAPVRGGRGGGGAAAPGVGRSKGPGWVVQGAGSWGWGLGLARRPGELGVGG